MHESTLASLFKHRHALAALVIFAGISAWLAYYIHTGSISLYSEAESAITQIHQKRYALSEMTSAARERSVILLEMYILEDPFDRDSLRLEMDTEAARFIKFRQVFQESTLSNEESRLFSQALELISDNVPIQKQTVELLLENRMADAGQLLFEKALPNQSQILDKFSEIHHLMEANSLKKVASLKNHLNNTNRNTLLLLALVIGATFIAFTFIYSRAKNRERDLQGLVNERTRELEKAHRLTQSLVENSSDGIISINKDQNIVLFNPAAEKLFQYSASDIAGQHISILLPDEARNQHQQHVTDFGNDPQHQSKMMDARPEVMGKRRDNSLFPAEVSICKSQIGDETCYTAFVRDITERREAEAEIRRLAMSDSLTGLDNKHHFHKQLEDAVAYHNRYPEHRFSLLMLDLDLFKQVNDTHGHLIGDKLLQLVSNIIRRNVRNADRVGRLGGDEFAILLNEVCNASQAAAIAEKIIHELSRPINIDGNAIQIGASIGIAICPTSEVTAETLLNSADKMLYKSKSAGRNTYRIEDSK